MSAPTESADADEHRAEDYDQLVDWERRLARELPFFRELLSVEHVRRVLDVGCGSGRHAVALTLDGYEVTGVDPSAEMLAQARHNAQLAGAQTPFVEGGYGELRDLARGGAFESPVDAVFTLGNGLPHVDGIEGLRAALRDIADVLRPGGVFVAHLLNHERLLALRLRSLPPVVRETPEGTRVFARVLDYVEGGIVFDFLTLTRAPSAVPPNGSGASVESRDSSEDWSLRSRRSVHTALPVQLLAEELHRSGFDGVQVFGDHTRRPVEIGEDESVVVLARREI